jgi:hypothetical protein
LKTHKNNDVSKRYKDQKHKLDRTFCKKTQLFTPYWFIYSLILWTHQRWASTMEKSELEEVSDSRGNNNQYTTSNNQQGPTTTSDIRQSSARTRQPTPDTYAGTNNTSDIRQSSANTRQLTPDRHRKTTNTDSQIRKLIKTDIRRQPTANNCR